MIPKILQKTNNQICCLSINLCKGGIEMIHSLLQDIIKYFDYLQLQGYYVAFHNLRIPMESCMTELTPYNINSNPFCLLVKSNPEAWAHCIERQPKVLKACEGGSFCGMCYAGMGEAVFPVREKGGKPIAFISVSGYGLDEEQAMQRIKKAAAVYGHSEEQLSEAYLQYLKQGSPDLDELSVKISPLSRMFELLNMLLCDLPHGSVGNLTQNSILSHAVVYIRRHYAESVSAADVADSCHCSVSTLSHLFKKKMGVSISRYIQQLRMDDAVRLLKETDLPVNAVSNLLGYGNPNYFCNVFRKEMSIAPTQFRSMHRTGGGE